MIASKASYTARGGLYTAVSIIFLYLSAYIPNNKFFFLAAASCIIPLSIITIGIKHSFIVYLAVSFIGIFLIGSKGILFLYIVFFGLYGFVKYAVEKIKNLPLELLLKIAFLNISILLSYFISRLFMNYNLSFKISLYIVIIAIQIIFLIYDYTLTLFIAYMHKTFKKRA